MSLTPRTDLAIEFLQRWSADGPWVLTSIGVDGAISTRTFLKEHFQEMLKWVNAFNGKRNLYFTINKVRCEMDSKPKRTDITEIVALHLDVDPRIGEDITTERIRILKSLQEFSPKPSVITDSGTGYQAFWLLELPVILDGTEPTALDAESYSIQLELLLGGDRTSNCDRVMRIPGTINLPNEVKKKKGRVAALASVVEWNDTRYPISIFAKAQIKIQSPGTEPLARGIEKVQLSGNIAPIYLEDLEKEKIIIRDDIKQLIVQGKDLDNPQRFPSRSEALWAVVCALVRAGASDDVVAGILLNRDNGISSSVLDKPRPERYAAKQIQDAKEEVEDPRLREFNQKHAVIGDFGGKCRIISEVFDPSLNRSRISYQSFNDFWNRYCNIKIQIAVDKNDNPVMKPLGKWWAEHPKRRQYETVVFAPGKEVPNVYNLWQGFSVEAIPGDCSLYLEHVRMNICGGNEVYYDYIVNWMARCVQHPDCQGETAIVLRGEMGTGKGIFARCFGTLFGRHFLQISDSKHLVGSFNAHLRDCCIVFADEAFYAGDKKHESVLKALVTETHLTVEAKGVDVYASANYTHLIMASNSQWVVPAGSNERRFFVLDVDERKMQDKKYFAAILKQMNEGGKEALLQMLLTHNIKDYEVRDIPKTMALQDQKTLSQSPEESWWFEKLEEGRILRDNDYWEKEIMKQELHNDYVIFMTRMGILRKASPTVLGKFLGRVCPGGVPRRYQKITSIKMTNNYGEEYLISKRMYFYEFPELKKCRDYWDKHYGGPFKWSDPLEKGDQGKLDVEPEAAFK